MTFETTRALVNVNGVAVPGIFRNGAFLSETPIETFIVYRSGPFSANQSKSFIVDFPCKPRTVLVGDSNADATYTFAVNTPDGFIWTMAFSASNTSQVISYGSTKLIVFPVFVLDKGAKITVSSNKQIQSVAFFTNLSFNIDVNDF